MAIKLSCRARKNSKKKTKKPVLKSRTLQIFALMKSGTLGSLKPYYETIIIKAVRKSWDCSACVELHRFFCNTSTIIFVKRKLVVFTFVVAF